MAAAEPAAIEAATAAPYAGITVLDLSHVYLGPYCTMLMSRLGADVIKIEPPGGEPLRSYRAAGGGETAAFALVNAGKRGLCLDLKNPHGREVFLRLVEVADVVVENFSPNTLERLDLDYEALAERNERIILASGRGYGEHGPYQDYPAMDLMVQALAGVLAATGFPENPPVKSGAAIADFAAGSHLLAAIGAALYQRAVTGRGQHARVAMHDSLLPAMASPLAAFIDSGGTQPERTGNRHSGLAVAPYNVYPADDGWIAVLALTDRHWRSLCEVMGRRELATADGFVTNRERVERMEEVDRIVAEWTASHPKRVTFDLLSRAGVPAAPVLSLGEVVTDPQVQAQGMLQEATAAGGETVLAFGSPLRLGSGTPNLVTSVPGVGSDSREVLAEKLGLGDKQFDELQAAGALG